MKFRDALRSKVAYLYIFSVLQLIIFIFYGVFFDFSNFSNPSTFNSSNLTDLIFIALAGFGLLSTYLKFNAFSALCLSVLSFSYGTQWAIFVLGFLHQLITSPGNLLSTIRIGTDTMFNACIAALTPVISLGAVQGKISPLQAIIVTFFEIFFFGVMVYINNYIFRFVDLGGAVSVHVFGGTFGLFVSKFLSPRKSDSNPDNSSRYSSDIFSLIGACVLFAYWPRLNSMMSTFFWPEVAITNRSIEVAFQHSPLIQVNSTKQLVDLVQLEYSNMVGVTTFLSMMSSGFCSFIFPGIIGSDKTHIAPRDIQNTITAGGVMAGTVASMYINPLGAVVLGAFAAFVTTISRYRLHPLLTERAGLEDTRGVFSSHGLPGIVGGLVSAAILGFLYLANGNPTSHSSSLLYSDLFPNWGPYQALIHVAAVVIAVLVAALGGTLTGMLGKLFDAPSLSHTFTDRIYWVTTPDFIRMSVGIQADEGGDMKV